jgi:hypothetical protein
MGRRKDFTQRSERRITESTESQAAGTVLALEEIK